jgi:alanine-glyoxylate transaminase/serine-glyoxylate transaminase/serine-pyruvate transaminase
MDAMTEQPMDMADERLDPLIAQCEVGLRSVMRTKDAEVFVYASNGHGLWEAVTVNLAAPGQTVLIASTGHFSDSWALMTQAMGVSVVRTPYREGYPIDPTDIESQLKADARHDIVAVYVVQTDTASSITSDVPAIRQAMDRTGHPALLVVDVVASLAATQYEMDAWGVNVTVGASQKGLMCPPGMAFCAVDARALAVAKSNPAHRFYWDWERRREAPSYRKFCGTPPQTFLQGLRAAIELLHLEGLDQVLARHRRFAAAVHAAIDVWAEGGKLSFVCQVPQARSVSVTTIAVQGVDPDQIRRVAREQFNVSLAGGLGPFSARAFRIGHLGDLSVPMVLGCLSAVQGTLRTLKVPIGAGALDAALDALQAAR